MATKWKNRILEQFLAPEDLETLAMLRKLPDESRKKIWAFVDRLERRDVEALLLVNLFNAGTINGRQLIAML